MVDMRYMANVTPTRHTSDGSALNVQGTRDGAPSVIDWYAHRAMEGRMFVANVGTGTSPTTFNATFAAAEQDLFIHVPDGTAIIPVSISVAFEDTGTAQVMDVVAAASATGDASVSGTSLTVRNMRSDAPVTSNCTATSVITSGGTDVNTGNYVEFWRPYAGFADDAFGSSVPWRVGGLHGASWSARTATDIPVIMGVGSLSLWASAQAGIGFLKVAWVEVPENMIG